MHYETSKPVWQRVSSGKYIDIANLQTSDVDIVDVVRSLATMHRSNGHGFRALPLTVLQHSLLVEHLAKVNLEDIEVRLACLLHDAHEYITGDMTAPMKQLTGYEEPIRIIRVVREALAPDVWPYMWRSIKRYDNMALDIERKAIWHNTEYDDQFWPEPNKDMSGEEASAIHSKFYSKGTKHFYRKYESLRSKWSN